MVTPDADSEALIAAVEAALSATDVRPLTDLVSVDLADEVEYTLHCKVWYPAGLNIATAIETAKDDYQKWQDDTIGRAFNPDKLTASLYMLGATRVQYQDGDGIDGGGATYTEIEPREHCVGTIELELVVES